MNELEREHCLGTIAFAYIRQHPVRFVGRSLVKLVRLHERESIGVVWSKTALNKLLPPSAFLVQRMPGIASRIALLPPAG